MKSVRSFLAATSVALFLFACQKNVQRNSAEEPGAQSKAAMDGANGQGSSGYVYTLSNQTSGNKVLVYSRTSSGKLSYMACYPTGGTGTGGGLGNQGAIALADHSPLLIAVNAGSNSISSFMVSNSGLQWVSTVSSGGTTPVSVTIHNNIVYVLNSGGTGNIHGFMVYADGSLHPIAGSSRPLSAANAGAAQISFVADGSSVAITEKATNKIITYTIDAAGNPGMMHSITSAHPTPFGFAVGKKGVIYVSEAAGGAPNASAVSSYQINSSGMISLIEGPVSAQTAACWVVITNNGKYVYTTNTGSNSISSFNTNNMGALSILSAAAAMTGMGTAPIDAALTNNSKYLYVLNSGNESIGSFSVNNDGSLAAIETVSGLPNGATGLVAK
jgi:6-phosphogluconolactonase (cycloisomerase 2 family)